jgi:hypothetical protein
MRRTIQRLVSVVARTSIAFVVLGSSAHAAEMWIVPTLQQDLGGFGVGSNLFWPVSAIGATRLAWSVPDDFRSYENVRIRVIRDAPAVATTLTFYLCHAAPFSAVPVSDCHGPFSQPIGSGNANLLVTVDIGFQLSPFLQAGHDYALVAFTGAVATDHILGMKFSYHAITTPDAIVLPSTSDANRGVLYVGSARLHSEGQANVFLGENAGSFTNTGGNNIGIGADVLHINEGGESNIAIGPASLYQNISGSNNIGMGHSTLFANTSGSENIGIGWNVLVSNSTGQQNVVVGSLAMRSNQDGSGNVAIGYDAGTGIASGAQNTFIGFQAHPGGSTPFVNATAIGANAVVSASNALVLGGSSVNVGIGASTIPTDKLDVPGNIRVGTGTTGCVRDRDSTIIAGTCSSDMRLKRNVESFGAVLDKLTQVRPVYFDWRADEFPDFHLGRARSYGLIAQEVEQLLPELVTEDEQGFKAVKYSQLPLLLLQALRELKAESDRKDQAISAQEAQIRQLRDDLEDVKAVLKIGR